MSKWQVRRAVEADKEWVKEQCKEFLQSIALPIPYNEQHIEQLFYNSSINSLIVERDGEKCGLGVYMIVPHMFNPNVSTFSELVWWVVPEMRGTRAGLVLLDALDTVAQTCDMAVMSVEAESVVNARCLERRGYFKQETSFVKRT